VDGVLNFNTLEKAQEAAQEFRASLQENSEEPTFVKIEWHLPTEQSTEIKNLRKLLSTYRKVHSDSIWVELK
jgi:D-mannonate dehydratase